MAAKRSTTLFLVVLLLHHAEGLLGQWGTLVSLSHSLMIRVANARAARGDHAAAERARGIADKIHLFGGGRGIWSAGWDFAWHYMFRGGIPSGEIYRSASEIMSVLAEFYRLDSGEERAGWIFRNYPRLLVLSKSLFRTLLRSFSRPGALREAVLVMQKEVVDGELLRDCLEVGAADLEGLVRVARDMFFSAYSRNEYAIRMMKRMMMRMKKQGKKMKHLEDYCGPYQWRNMPRSLPACGMLKKGYGIQMLAFEKPLKP